MADRNEQTWSVLCAYLDGALSVEEIAALRERLQREPALRTALAELVYQRQLLVELGEEQQQRAVVDTAGREKRVKWWVPMSVAAGIAVIVGLWLTVYGPRFGDAAEVVARVEKGVGCRVSGVGGERTLELGDDVRAGEKIETGEGGSVVLAYGVGAKVEVGEMSRLRFEYSVTNKRLPISKLEKGKLSAEVAKQPAGRPFIVETPHGRVTVLGTRFTLRVEESEGGKDQVTEQSQIPSTRLQVEEGLVRFTRLGDGVSVEVPAGCGVSTGEDMAMKVVSLTPALTVLANLRGHSADNINALRFSPDGTRFLSCGGDRTTRVWDVQTRRELFALRGHKKAVMTAAFSPDGKTIATGSFDRTVRIWRALDGKPITQLDGHINQVWSVGFSPDGATLASASEDFTVILWDTDTWRRKKTLEGHSGPLRALVYSPEGDLLATGANDKTVRLWDLRHGDPPAVYSSSNSITEMAYSPGGETIAVTDYGGMLTVLDGTTLGMRVRVQAHPEGSLALAFSPDGRMIATAGPDPSIAFWDAETLELLVRQDTPLEIVSLAFGRDGRILAGGDYGRSITLFEIDRTILTNKNVESMQ